MIKIRLPNGLTRELNLPQEYRVGYLYDYVLSDPAEDIGFENDLDRNFEFVRPYETLDLDKSKTLGDAFPGSKMEYLIVKEL